MTDLVNGAASLEPTQLLGRSPHQPQGLLGLPGQAEGEEVGVGLLGNTLPHLLPRQTLTYPAEDT